MKSGDHRWTGKVALVEKMLTLPLRWKSLPGHGKVHGATAVKPGRMKLHYGGTPQQAPKHAFSERGVEFASAADGSLTFRVGKGAAGRLLDGREHSEFPKVAV